MTRPVLYFAITNHGFGHAVRSAVVAAEVQRLDPDILLVMVTTAPHWLLSSYISGDFIHRPCALDVGVVQSDSLTVDKPATLAKLQHLRKRHQRLIEAEVNFIQQNEVGLLLADTPALASAIAQAADIPGWVMGNFGWDFIYRSWGPDFADMGDWFTTCYSQSQHLFRLPMHEAMAAFSEITDVGLVGDSPRHSLETIRQQWSLTAPPERTVLLTFGGLNLKQIPYHNLEHFPDWQFITFDRQAPKLPNLIPVWDHRYRPVDFMPCCGRVVSKPGFSTFAEALRLGAPIVSLTRNDFAEVPLLLDGIQNYGQHQVITPEAFFRGPWEFLHQPLDPPRRSEKLDPNGHQAIATAIVSHFQSAISPKTWV